MDDLQETLHCSDTGHAEIVTAHRKRRRGGRFPYIYSELVPQFSTLPAVNQVECNPTFQQKELRKLMDKDDVKLEAWYPLGHGNRKLLENLAIVRMAQKYGKNVGQLYSEVVSTSNFLFKGEL